MATLVVLQITQTGAAPSFVAASGGGDTFANNGVAFLHVKNGGGSPINVTVASIKACDQGFSHDVVVAVPAGAEREIGPFPVARFGRSPSITYSAVTSVTVAVLSE